MERKGKKELTADNADGADQKQTELPPVPGAETAPGLPPQVVNGEGSAGTAGQEEGKVIGGGMIPKLPLPMGNREPKWVVVGKAKVVSVDGSHDGNSVKVREQVVLTVVIDDPEFFGALEAGQEVEAALAKF